MSTFETGSPRVLFQVKPGSNVARLNGLKSGTLYAVLMRGAYGSRTTNVIQPGTSGAAMGQVTFGTLPAAAQAQITALQSEMGVNYPNGYFVAGGSANTVRDTPTWSVDKDSSKETFAIIKVAVPSFSDPLPSYLAGVRMRLSSDGGDTYGRFEDLKVPFADNANYATFTVPVPYEQKILVKFQAIYKDGTFGRECRPVEFTGVAKPANPPSASPVLGTVSGAYTYSSKNNKLQLSLTVQVTPDPASGSAVVQAVDGTGTVRATGEVLNTVPGTVLNVVLEDVDPSVTIYTINAYSNSLGKLSAATSTTFTTSTASSYTPTKLDPTKIYLSEEIYRMGDGTLESRIRVKFEGALDAERTRGSIYTRNRNTTSTTDLPTFNGFTKVGMAIGNFLTDAVAASSTQQWDVVVLAVGKDGTEAAFSSDQIKTVSVVQYSNYQPPQQAVPVVTVSGENSVLIMGTYVRAPGTPEPVKIRAYKSETVGAIGDKIGTTPELISDADFTYLGDGNYTYSLIISDVSVFTVGSNNYDITLRAVLENGNLHATSTKTTVRVTRALPSAPGVVSVTPYVKTVKGVLTGFSALSVSSQSGYTPASGGNGTTLTITPPNSAVVVEVSDPGYTPGLNPELVTNASVDSSTGIVTFTPATNSGSRNIRFAWKTSFGNSAWSAATQITFPTDNVVDSTVPDNSVCYPLFYSNSDGSITINWSPATFGPSGMGSYTIRRATSNNGSISTVVGTVTSSYINGNFSWTDFIDQSRIGTTYYYFLEATSAQGVKSASMVAVRQQPAAAYPTTSPTPATAYAGTAVVAAVSTDSAPAVPTGLTVKGAQGGFDITWANNTERDLKEYVLEFSALGTFADTVTTIVRGTSYFQTLGATAAKATADVYRWRLKSRDFGGNTSAATANAIPDNTNYGSVTDNAPNNPSSVSIVNNADGSITLTITQSATNVGVYYRVVRKSWASIAGWGEGTGGTVENDIQIPAGAASSTTTYRDAGLKAGLYYNYRVYSRSKLGTESAGFVYATAPLAATDTTPPIAPTIAVTPNRGVSSVVVTPAEANGTIELWCNIGTTTWNAGTATKVAAASVGTTADAIAFSIEEADAANPVGRAWAARHIDAWGNVSAWSTSVSGTALNFLRADLIDATYIKAASIGVDILKVGTVQKQSLVCNGHFGTYSTYGDNTSGWTLGGGTSFVQSGTYTPGGSTTALNVARFDRTGTGVLAEQTITVLPGQTYTVVGLVVLATAGEVASLRVMALDGTTRLSSATSNPSAGAVIPDFYKGQGITAAQTNNADSASTINTWNLIAYKVTIPSGMTQVRLQLALDSASGASQVYSSFIQMYSDSLVEASASADQVNQLKAIAYGGDVSGTYDNLTVRSIQNRLVGTTAPTDKQALAWDNATSKYSPMSVATMLGYTPANKAGDTFTGAVVLYTGVLPTASSIYSTVTLVGGDLGSPWAGKTYFGDGTGWKYAFSRRSAGVDTDVLTIQDNGNITSMGSISASTGTFSSNITTGGRLISTGQTSVNIHIDSTTGANSVYLNYYQGTGGTKFGNGASGVVASIDGSGNGTFNGALTATKINGKSNLSNQQAPLNYSYIGTTDDSVTDTVVLLHPAYNGTLINKYLFDGTITFQRGSTGSSNISDNYNVKTSTAYSLNTGSIISRNNRNAASLVTCTYNSVLYVAVYVPKASSRDIFYRGDLLSTLTNPLVLSASSVSNVSVLAQDNTTLGGPLSATTGTFSGGITSILGGTDNGGSAQIINSSSGAYGSIVAQGSNGYGLPGWSNSFVVEGVPASGGNTVISSYTGSLIFQVNNRNINALTINNTGAATFASSVSMGALSATSGTFSGSVYITNTNTGITASGFSLHAGNGYALRFWNGADAYSIGMNDYSSTSFGNNGYNTGGADYNMCFRMDGSDSKRGGSDSVARGFLFRNNSLGSNTFAQLAPFGNYTYWGGMLMLRDSGNNNMYGLFVLNGVLYLKQMA